MTVTPTRLLLLAAVALFEPVNGYQIRRELLSWRVDEWAHINPGSIYTGLATLARRGHLVRHDLRDGGRDVAVYELTASGREELEALFCGAVRTVDLHSPLGFHVALSMLPLFPRDRVLQHLEARGKALQERLEELAGARRRAGEDAPPHVDRMVDLWYEHARTESRWLTAVVEEIRTGALSFAGEPMAWTPTPDDPGRQMQRDRARYQHLLGRS
jgi:DNA-binding PadR family transcriptional regulator